jgi:aspartate aminotransferase-like enzyme
MTLSRMNVESKTHLMTPGPVASHPDILKTLGLPMIHHLSKDFQATLSRVLPKLKEFFVTNETVFLHMSTGYGGLESAVVNTLSPGDEVLVIVSGKFGERWAEICEMFGLKTERWNIPWGDFADPAELKKKLETKPYKAVLTQACESSTGVLQPIEDFGRLTRQTETLLLVDGISSVGAVKLPMDAWGIDVLVTGSQKSLMLPAGLAMISLSVKAKEASKKSKLPKYYWNLNFEEANLKKGRTHFSSSVSLIRALDTALDLVLKSGLNVHLSNVEKKSTATLKAGETFGLRVFAKRPSQSLTAFQLPEGVPGEDVLKSLEKQNIYLAGGQDKMLGKLIRIGHMGHIENEDVVYVLRKLFSLLLEKSPQSFTAKNLDLAIAAAQTCLKS